MLVAGLRIYQKHYISMSPTAMRTLAAADLWRRLQPNRFDWRRCAEVGGLNIYSRPLICQQTNKQERDAAAALTLTCWIREEPNFGWCYDPDVYLPVAEMLFFFPGKRPKHGKVTDLIWMFAIQQTSVLDLLIIFPRYKSGSQIFTDCSCPRRHYAGALTRCYRRLLRVGGFENIFFWIPTDSWLPVPIPLKADSSLRYYLFHFDSCYHHICLYV